MSRRGSARADALRRAHATRTDRDAARQLREAQIESALADYYLAVSLAKRIRDTGRRKAQDAAAEADRAAAPQDAAAAGAVRRLRGLLGGVAETAQVCGLSTTTVREVLSGRPELPLPARPPGTAASHRPGLAPKTGERGPGSNARAQGRRGARRPGS